MHACSFQQEHLVSKNMTKNLYTKQAVDNEMKEIVHKNKNPEKMRGKKKKKMK